jgi:alginate O-acetyltransferase complex protein AlgJ
MKNRVFVFICAALLVLMVVPVVNVIKSGNRTKKGDGEWWSKSVLYNVDPALPFLNRFFYQFGISTNSDQVIIGKDNWLFLGDQYEKVLTVTRRGATVEDEETAKKIEFAAKSWERWLKLKGVQQYRVILGSDKGSIYPEFFPDWVQPANYSASDMLLAHVSQQIYVDTRPAIKAAKTQFSEPLFYKTDSHWNILGAWAAFHAFTINLARTETGLRWLSEQHVHISEVNKRHGGDLANFLRMREILWDSEVTVEIVNEHPFETEQYDFETGRLLVSGGNPQIETSALQHPLLVKSKHALNRKRVLWLRDSFGNAMAPFMAATFTETLQHHYSIVTNPSLLARLVDTFKPDYVFITVVERGAREKWFENLPPSIIAAEKPKDFISLSQGTPSKINDMMKMEGTGKYQISGADPFVTFTLSNPVQTHGVSQLVFELNCGERNEPVHIQVFWHTAGNIFSEAESAHFVTNPGTAVIDLSSISSWAQAGTVTGIRIDIDSPGVCPEVTLNNLELGRVDTMVRR